MARACKPRFARVLGAVALGVAPWTVVVLFMLQSDVVALSGAHGASVEFYWDMFPKDALVSGIAFHVLSAICLLAALPAFTIVTSKFVEQYQLPQQAVAPIVPHPTLKKDVSVMR